MTLTEFLHMGGYAFYVWTSYGLALIILIFNWIASWRRERQLLRELLRRARRANKSQTKQEYGG